VQYADANGAAHLKPTGSAVWYYVADAKVLATARAIYENPEAELGLFHVVVGPAAETYPTAQSIWTYGVPTSHVEVYGTATAGADLLIGSAAGSNADVFEFYMGQLNATNAKLTGALAETKGSITVYNGAYLNLYVPTDDSIVGGTFTNAYAGLLEVKDGGKLRDGAGAGYPLGEGNIKAHAGARIAVGAGYADGTNENASVTEVTSGNGDGWKSGYLAGQAGWLIGQSTDTTPISIWGTALDSGGGMIGIGKNKLYINAHITVKRSTAMPYDIVLSANATLELANSVELHYSGAESGNEARHIYGSATSVNWGTHSGATGSRIVLGANATIGRNFFGAYTLTGTVTDASGVTLVPGTSSEKPWTDSPAAIANGEVTIDALQTYFNVTGLVGWWTIQ
jgi:hypothetical protein